MDSKTFEQHLAAQQQRTNDTLSAKGKEYAGPTDRLHNFKQAAHMSRVTQAEALGGMMVKHTVSIYDMIDRGDVTAFTREQWQEKIGDHINYLILLNAIVEEELPAPEVPDEPQVFLSPSEIQDLIKDPTKPVPSNARSSAVALIVAGRKKAQENPYMPTPSEQADIQKLINNPGASIPAQAEQGFIDAVEYGRRLAKESTPA